MIVYIASSKKYVGIIQEDIYIKDEYLSMGISSEIASLSDIIKKSKVGDIVILKSIWGYHTKYKIFLKQINVLKNKGIKLVNDYSYVMWNINKYKYLNDVNFLKVIPTKLLQFNKCKNSGEINSVITLETKNLTGNLFVIKPAISASGYLTFLYDRKNNNTVSGLLLKNKKLDFILQPYRPSIINGELSVILIKGDVLYSINRYPGIFLEKKDPEYIPLSNTPTAIVKLMPSIKDFFISKFKEFPTICRIDFVKNNLEYEIIEIELIDPDLFLKCTPEKVRRNAISLLCNN